MSSTRAANTDDRRQHRSNVLLNVALALLGMVLLVLLYGLGTRLLAPRVDPGREANPANFVGDILQVEVRNGCGISGVAAVATQYLRRGGFDVVEVGDHTSFEEPHSHVIDRVGDPEAARKIAYALGIDPERIVEDVRLDFYLDATVVLGKDYATLKPFNAD